MAPAQPAENASYVGIETSASTGLSRAAFFSSSGARLALHPLDFRAHGMARHGETLVVFPRRPGNRFAVVDMRTLMLRTVVTAPPDRHFYGHGAFSVDGRHLLVTENDLTTLQGSIGVYELGVTATRLGQIALPGSGPHEIIRDPVSDRFLVALGGLQTHPDYGRTPLNLSEFHSQIVAVDFRREALDGWGVWSGTAGISLRHMAQDGDGRLYIGGQVADARRADGDRVLWLVQDGRETAVAEGGLLAGYVSSVAAHGSVAKVTSKQAGVVLSFESGRATHEHHLVGASALGLGPNTSAVSGFRRLSVNANDVEISPGFEFDNHGLALL